MAQISGQLDEQNTLLRKLVGALAPEPPADPEPGVAPDEKPTPKAPAKKAATRKKVTGQ
ncbi:hypothetical protein ACFPJ1_40675 [Kribbella qitaiheensis]|uniref:hypothetical protein n=1 Tax=Kribbella qitaiheensis TaxID=1544730 RepID=UPI00361722CE